MADNTPVTNGTGDVIRDKDRAGVKTQIVGLDIGIGTSSESLMVPEPFGAIPVHNGHQTLFYDSWSTALDTTDKWTVTGNAPAITGGNMDMSATLSSYNAIRTKDSVRANVGFSLVRNGIRLETGVGTGAGRFWGLGNVATVPAAAVLAQDGIGYEIDQATGALLAVTYSAGVRTTVATLTRPTDGAMHAYGCYFRVTQAYWLLDGAVVASQSFPNVTSVELPALIVRQNAASFTNSPVFVNIAHLTADTSRQGVVIADPIIGTRQARVGADGTVKVSGTGTAGTPSTAVVSVQGVASGTAQNISPPAITKGTQGSTGVTTQDLKDSGRVNIHWTVDRVASATAAETAATVTESRDGAATTTFTSKVITSGKRLRITSILFSVECGGSTPVVQRVYMRMRFNTAGAVTTASPLQHVMGVSVPATAKTIGTLLDDFPDGIEFVGDGTRQIGFTFTSVDYVGVTNIPLVSLSVFGFEY